VSKVVGDLLAEVLADVGMPFEAKRVHLQRMVARALGPTLGRVVKVKHLRNGKLTLEVPHGTWRITLEEIRGELRSKLNRRLPTPIDEIRLQVTSERPAEIGQITERLDEKQVRQVEERFSQAIEDDEIRRSFARLVVSSQQLEDK